MAPLVLILGIAAAALVALFVLLDVQRTRAWKELAGVHGWQYLARESGLGRFGRFRACRAGQDHRLQRRVFGPLEGARVDVAEIAHTERDLLLRPKQRSTVQTACLVEDPGLHLPAFFSRPRSPIDELGRLANLQDIAFPEDPDFSAAMLVQGEEVDAIRARFDGPSRAWLARHAPERWSYEGVGDALLVVAPRTLGEAELKRLVGSALELARIFKSTPPQQAQEKRP
ncbi:MAG TPA: hypothetical protein VGK67_06180 [Myxococcales bacterium]|jgi:hypothetical protein